MAQGLVLLKNSNSGSGSSSSRGGGGGGGGGASGSAATSTLPLKRGIKLAVVGPHANSTWQLLSDYYGDQVCFGENEQGIPVRTNTHCIHTIGTALAQANVGGETKVAAGVGIVDAGPPGAAEAAMAAVAWADTTVLCVGNDHGVEHEGIDRKSVLLSDVQAAFADQVVSSGKEVVLVVINGGAIAIDKYVSKSAAIIEAFYPNQAGASALGPALFGETNRWGKLPLTMYPAA